MTCQHCVDAEGLFGERTARREIRRYHRRGARASTAELVEMLKPNAAGSDLLDVGGGVGMVQHELFVAGLRSATQVDASKPYLNASEEEARKRGNVDRTTYLYGDLVELADEVPPVDLVVLDRVLCCYPDAGALIRVSTDRARVRYAIVIPRRNPLVRMLLAAGNVFLRLRGSAFRTFLHPPEEIETRIEGSGFELEQGRTTLIWRVLVYRRAS